MPTSSQPAIGEVEDLYNRYPEDEIVNVTMALGLSGGPDASAKRLKLLKKLRQLLRNIVRLIGLPIKRFMIEFLKILTIFFMNMQD